MESGLGVELNLLCALLGGIAEPGQDGNMGMEQSGTGVRGHCGP